MPPFIGDMCFNSSDVVVSNNLVNFDEEGELVGLPYVGEGRAATRFGVAGVSSTHLSSLSSLLPPGSTQWL